LPISYQALEVKDYETAAKFVEKFLQLDAEFETETGTEQRRQMVESKQKLETLIRRNLAAAIEAKDHANVVRFVKLYPPLNLQEEGLQSYVGYLRKVVAMRAVTDYERLVKSLGSIDRGTTTPFSVELHMKHDDFTLDLSVHSLSKWGMMLTFFQ